MGVLVFYLYATIIGSGNRIEIAPTGQSIEQPHSCQHSSG
jgi:hypothetical protein